jgi:hypothetical protein
VLTRLRGCVRRKRPGLWPGKWILHHDNAPAPGALSVREFLAKNSITQIDHPPYPPDLVPRDFWLFPKLETALRGQKFADLSDIKRNVKTLLRGIPEKLFSRLFPSAAPSSHEVHSFTRRVFQRRQQPSMHMSAILLSQGHSGN